METPICDFVRKYSDSDPIRLHMPGHKGEGFLGVEELDITEISGADSLFSAEGIICESEKNASLLFGCDTYYSAEGSSLCIKTMLYLTALYAKKKAEKPLIFAGRNAHKAFINAAALIDFDLMWLYGEKSDGYLSCNITAPYLEKILSQAERLPTAVYITGPDYLGNICNIADLSRVCKKHEVLLLVDNAHGAYLKFLEKSEHPIDLGADMCCDSAHKTLPCLTPAAYLHLSDSLSAVFGNDVKSAMSLFASTSPSYLILQSLDKANEYLSDGYRYALAETVGRVEKIKGRLEESGYILTGEEKLKISVSTKPYGYYGTEIADYLEKKGIFCEFADKDYIVFMFSEKLKESELRRFTEGMSALPARKSIDETAVDIPPGMKRMSLREAVFSDKETLPLSECKGRIFADANVACPPAVPIVICGEEISSDTQKCLEYYGVTHCRVVKE